MTPTIEVSVNRNGDREDAVAMLLLLEDCQAGKHAWSEIHREFGAASDKVTRWCGVCGCVVVDEDYDGRTNPGTYRKISASDLYRHAVDA